MNNKGKRSYDENSKSDLEFIYKETFPVVGICNGEMALFDDGRTLAENATKIPEDLHYFGIRDTEREGDVPVSTLEDYVLVDRYGYLVAKTDLLEQNTYVSENGNRSKELEEDDQIDFDPVSSEIYGIDWDGEMSISDFQHLNDPEFHVVIEETRTAELNIKARDEEEAEKIAIDKYKLGLIKPKFVTNTRMSVNDSEFKDFYAKVFGSEGDLLL